MHKHNTYFRTTKIDPLKIYPISYSFSRNAVIVSRARSIVTGNELILDALQNLKDLFGMHPSTDNSMLPFSDCCQFQALGRFSWYNHNSLEAISSLALAAPQKFSSFNTTLLIHTVVCSNKSVAFLRLLVRKRDHIGPVQNCFQKSFGEIFFFREQFGRCSKVAVSRSPTSTRVLCTIRKSQGGVSNLDLENNVLNLCLDLPSY